MSRSSWRIFCRRAAYRSSRRSASTNAVMSSWTPTKWVMAPLSPRTGATWVPTVYSLPSFLRLTNWAM